MAKKHKIVVCRHVLRLPGANVIGLERGPATLPHRTTQRRPTLLVNVVASGFCIREKSEVLTAGRADSDAEDNASVFVPVDLP